MCYTYDPNGFPVIAADYLHRTGYRLPTEAEWEFACRAGSVTPYSWGNNSGISPRFSWTSVNSGGHNHPAGSLCPNRWGLFDMHGSASEWMFDVYRDEKKLPAKSDDIEMTFPYPEIAPGGNVIERFNVVARSGNFGVIIEKSRSAARSSVQPYNGGGSRTGMRVARTLKSAADK